MHGTMRKLIGAMLCMAWLAAGPVAAQSWPAKLVRVVVSAPTGSAPDYIARLAADRLSKHYGQTFVVENVPGAAGLIATRTVVKAPPDGYTLLFAGSGPLVFDSHLHLNPGYKPDRDLVPIAMLYEQDRLSITVHPDVPARNLAELIALAKARPGKLSYGVPNAALPTMVGRWINKLAGTDMLAVTYKTSGQIYQDLLAGRIDWIIATPPQLEAFVRAGKMRIIAIDGIGRFAALPDIPTIAETFPGYRTSGFGILTAPRGISPTIVQSLNAAMEKVVRDPEYIRQLATVTASVNGAGTPEYIANFIRERRQYWAGVFKALDIQPQ